MAINNTSKAILKRNPTAVCIDYSKNPSMKGVMISIKSSPDLIVLEESNDHIIVAKKPSPHYAITNRRTKRRNRRSNRTIRVSCGKKPKEGIARQTLSALGVNVSPISKKKPADTSNIIKASGILFGNHK